MTQAIIFTNDNGGVSVCIPTGELPIEQVKTKDTPVGSLIVNISDLPSQYNDFFNAWELANEVVTVSLTKAKDIAKNNLRTERAPVLAALDVQFQRALESNSSTSEIVAKKQELRDITAHSSITGATTVDGLKTAMNNLINEIKAP